MLQGTWFWEACKQSYEAKKQSTLLVDLFVNQLEQRKDSVSVIYFPFVHQSHWIVGVIDLRSRQLEFAEGLHRTLPLNFVRVLTFVMTSIYGKEVLKSWNTKIARRLRCPDQHDSHSCGIIALSFIHANCVERFDDGDDWCQDLADVFRIRWIERVMSHHDPSWVVDDPRDSAFIRAKVNKSFELAEN